MPRTSIRPLCLLAGLALVVSALPALAQETGTPEEPESKLQGDARALYAIGVSIGDQLRGLQVGPEELEPVVRGLRDAALDQELMVDRGEFQQLIPAFTQARQQKLLEQEKAASETFLEQEAAKEASETLESGVIITRLEEGTGESPAAADEVKVHYRGTSRDGEEFDSSLGGDPAVFPLNQVISCWTEALQQLKVGGKARIVCPSDMAYGDRGRMPMIKPGAALVFEVELLEILEQGEADAEGSGAAEEGTSQTEAPETH
jgi:FKBP-type peptidyl-prolyl cis-trans isomerase